ncbi:DNA adenine methylase [Petroclostridium sp. X23]|uniref:DNA adenine methylase n=1 Tax=Petroclostridium sp. X23 TaxID=3045146 RepID=UPI0024ACC3C7|nr:DNA adenine methylase [Petroclostridium sp. X23]WHH58268.1 DNA adenine methylase [Petroclostridium sp. X23]
MHLQTHNLSPLRYPGGKAKLTNYIIDLMKLNNLQGCTYIEPFAGGAGAALALLFNEIVGNIIINDYDRAIYSFWYSVLNHTEELCDLIFMTPVTMDEWYKQKEIFSSSDDLLELGFATFFLNRTNRSGIIKGGVIGGMEQKGKYKLNCRFTKSDLMKRIKTIALYKDQITLTCMDACNFITDYLPHVSKYALVYLDPPYYTKGPGLYTNFYKDKDHRELARLIRKTLRQPWIVTYDNVEEISQLYSGYYQTKYSLNYSVNNKYKGQEILICGDNLIPVVSPNLRRLEACY